MKDTQHGHAALVRRFLAALAAGSLACAPAKEAEEKPEPALVKTAAVEEGPITEWIELQGRVTPPYDRDATLAPLVPGRIVLLNARVGDLVEEGAVVAKVETATLDDELKAAEAAARRSDADLVFKRAVAGRSRDLLGKGVASREEVESADAAVVAAESAQAQDGAALQTARRRRSWAEVRAPFAGAVVRVDRRIGDFVDGTSATPVLEIAATEGWEIVASATSASLQRLRAGQSAVIRGLPGEGEEGLGATVTAIARVVDPTTGAGDVRLRPRQRPAMTALGAAVRAQVAVSAHAKSTLIPKAALRMAADGSAEVVVVADGVAHVTRIEVGLIEGDRVEVKSDLKVGAHVVIEDPVGIAEGAALHEATATDEKDEDEGKGKEKDRDKEPAPKESPDSKK